MTGELSVRLEALDRADLCELAFELEDRAGERAAAADQVARDPDQHGLLAASEPAAHTLKLCGAVERTGRDRERRIEFVEMPAQPLLSAAPFVDEVVAMHNQQLQLAQALFTGPRSVEARLAQRRSGSGERVDRVRLPACPADPPLGRGQLRRHSQQPLTGRDEFALERLVTCRQSSTAHNRSLSSSDAQARSPSSALWSVRSASSRPLSSTATAVSECLCTSTPITIIDIASSSAGGDRRADRPHSRQLPGSYQVTLGGLGRRRRRNTGKSATDRQFGMESAAADPSLRTLQDVTTARRG
jgi:hypothetical protein